MPKYGQFWRFFENLKLAVKQCYQTGYSVKNWWKMPKLEKFKCGFRFCQFIQNYFFTSFFIEFYEEKLTLKLTWKSSHWQKQKNFHGSSLLNNFSMWSLSKQVLILKLTFFELFEFHESNYFLILNFWFNSFHWFVFLYRRVPLEKSRTLPLLP